MSPSSIDRNRTDTGQSGHGAGRMLWPRSATDLTDTALCPACHSVLTSPICSTCALDLNHPAAVELLAASLTAAEALESRVQLVRRIRVETDRARAARQAPVVATRAATVSAAAASRALTDRVTPTASPVNSSPSTTPLVSAPSAPAPQASASRAGAPAVPPFAAVQTAPSRSASPAGPTPPRTSPTGPAAPKRSSVQIVLLLVGVALVSVAAIFFLTVAWLFAGLGFRSVIVALFTLATLATAALLRRRKLVATAEGIGALAVVLVLLDAWAVRQNDLFGLASGDGLLYWGVTLTACTLLFLAWHVVSSLRVASVAGFAAASPALGLLAAGLAAGIDGTAQVLIGALGAAIGALLHRFTVPAAPASPPGTLTAGPDTPKPTVPSSAGHDHAMRWPTLDRGFERIALTSLALLALAIATIAAALVAPTSAPAPLLALGVVGLVALAHVVVVLTRPITTAGYRLFAYLSTVLATAAVTLGPILCAVRTENTTILITVPLLSALLLGLVLELFWRRTAASPTRVALLAGAITAAALAANPVVIVAGFAAWPLATATVAGFTQPVGPVSDVAADNLWALGTLVAAGAVTGAFWRVGGMGLARRRILVAFGLVVVLLAVPFTRWLWLVLPLFVLLDAAGLALVLRMPRRTLAGNRPTVVLFVVATAAAAWCISWTSSTSWWIGAAAMVATLFLLRALFDPGRRAGVRGALLGAAIVFTLIGAATAAWALSLPAGDPRLPVYLSLAVMLTTSLLLLVAAQPRLAVSARRLTPTAVERSWAFFTLLPTTVFAVIAPLGLIVDFVGIETGPTRPGELWLGILASAVIVTALLCWVLLPGNRAGLAWPRGIAAVLVAPAVFAVLGDLVPLVGGPVVLQAMAAPLAALITVAVALAVRLGALTSRALLGLEIGAALVLVAYSRLDRGDLVWLVLLVTAVTVLLSAIAPDGLLASRSLRRHLGWLALALGVASLWWGLAADRSIPVEAYTLPVAGALLLLAALLWQFGRVDRRVMASPGAAMLTLAGLAVGLLPLAITGQTGTIVRPLIVAAVSAILLLGAVSVRWTSPRAGYLAAAALAGALALLVTGAARSLRIVATAGPDARLEAWLLPTVAILALAAMLVVRQPDAPHHPLRERTAIATLVVALVTLSLLEAVAFDDTTLGTVRGVGLVVLLVTVHVLARWQGRAPLGAIVAWSSAALALAVGYAALQRTGLEPFELVTAPIGLALVSGELAARAGDGAGSGVSGRGIGITDGRDHRDILRYRDGRGRWVVTTGLTLILVPSAMVGAVADASLSFEGDLLRAVLVMVIGGALALAGALRLGRPWGALLGWPGCAVGLTAVVVVSTGRIGGMLLDGPADRELEAWLLPAALVLVATGACLVWSERRDSATRAAAGHGAAAEPLTAPWPLAAAGSPPAAGIRSRVGYGLAVTALVGVIAAEVPALDYGPLATIRVVLVVWLFAALHLGAFWADTSTAGRLVAWVAIGGAAVMVLAGWAQGVPDPVEIVSIPLAIALVASGLLHLDRTQAAGSWPWLAPGLLVLLLPSLLLDLSYSPLWRVVGLGVLGVVVLVIGTVRRLQAPFVIGAVVLLIHGVAQLWPWISLAYGAVPWWLWLGIGGVLLIVLAARYEQRIQNFKSVALRISALR